MAADPTIDQLCVEARGHLKAGRVQDAVQAFEEARRLNDLDPDVHDGLATAHCVAGAYEPAARHFEAVTRLDPRRTACWINLGAVHNRLGNFQKAAEVLRRAVQLDRKSSAAFYNLGFSYKQLKQWTLAVPAYREAIRLDPKMADAYLNLGNVYLEMGNCPQAVAQFKKALEINPELERARRGLEKADARQKASRQAESPFGRLVNLDAVAQSDSSAELGRPLTPEERQRDRHRLFDLLDQTRTDLQELLNCLGERIDPAVRTLNRLLTHQKSPHGETISRADALEQFQEARGAFNPRLLQLRRVLKQLRDHEAQHR